MKIIAALIALIAAQAASAERINKPFVTRNGKTVVGGSAPQVSQQPYTAGNRQALGVSYAEPSPGSAPLFGSGASSNGPYSSIGGRSFMSGGRRGVMSRGAQRGASQRSGKVFMGSNKSVDADPPAPAPADEVPAHFKTPGALIRTGGQPPKYTEVAAPSDHRISAGEIAFNEKRGYDVGRAISIHHGPKDTLPPPNPGTYQKTFTSGVGANSPGGTGGDAGGGNNNGSGNNDNDKPGDDDDGHGGSKKAGADPTGFYSAF